MDQQVAKEGWSPLSVAINTVVTRTPVKLWMLKTAADFPSPPRNKEEIRMEKCCGLGTVLSNL